MSEDVIIDRILSGDRQAFALLVSAYEHKAMSLAQRIVRDHDQAKDLVQDAFVKAYTNLGRFRRTSSFATWFYRIVYTTCLSALQRTQRQPMMTPIEDDIHGSSVEPTMFDEIDTTVLASIVREEIDNMPPIYAVVMELFYARDCSYEQIARITGMPLGTIKTRLNRGRNILRSTISKRLPDLEITS